MDRPTLGARRAAEMIVGDIEQVTDNNYAQMVTMVAEVIDRETSCAEMLEALQLALVSAQEGKRKFAETGDVMWCDAEDVIVAAIRRARGE